MDTLVNAAGMSQNRLLTFTRDEEIEQVLNTNLGGTIYTTRAFIKSFMKNKARDRSRGDDPDYSSKLGTDVGSIINISSLLGVKRGAGATAYAASKAGILGFTRALAHEMSMRDNRTLAIRVNAIVPGYIDTPMLDGMRLFLFMQACARSLICLFMLQILPIVKDWRKAFLWEDSGLQMKSLMQQFSWPATLMPIIVSSTSTEV